MSPLEPQVPPTGEEIHLPGPSIQPLLVAAGITMAVIGVTTSIVLVVAGALLTLLVSLRWIRDARDDIDELPLEHHH